MAGNVRIASNSLSNGAVVAIEMNWTGDAINGSVPDTAFPTARYQCDGFVVSNVALSIGDIAPTSGYTVRVYNSQGIDMLEGAGVGLSTIPYAFGVSSNIPPAYGGITLSVSGNSVPLAKGKIVVYFRQVSTTQLVQPADPTASAGTALTASDITSAYAWTRTPGASVALTAGVPATITLTPMPAGINGSSVNKHYVSVVTGSARKAYLITAVGASSITFTPALSYAAGSWALQSASGGIQEAIYATSYKSLTVPQGSISYDALRVWNPRKLQLNGQGKDATLIVIREATADVFLSDEWGLTVTNMGFRSLAGAQTGGICIGIVGSTPQYLGDADVNVWDCDFYRVWDAVKCSWPGGFVRVSNSYLRDIKHYGVYTFANLGYCAVQIDNNVTDGISSPGMFWIEGALAGGVINNNWMQKCGGAHVVVNNGGLVGELVIVGNQLDQDDVCTACVVVNGTGVEGTSQNCVKISANYMNCLYYLVLLQDAYNVMVSDNRGRWSGSLPAVSVAGSVATGYIDVSNNTFHMDGGAGTVPYVVQASNPVMAHLTVCGNKVAANSTIPAFLGIAGALTDCHVNGNSIGTNVTKLIDNVSATGAGQAICKDNSCYNQPALAVSAAATVTLPFADEQQIVAVSATGTPITEMNGVTARAGTKRTFIVDGAVTWATSSVANNKLGVGFGPTAAGDSVTWQKFGDNLWYVVARS
jgi:hypothetical protein